MLKIFQSSQINDTRHLKDINYKFIRCLNTTITKEMKKITYVFINGRIKNIKENTVESQEFYYGSLFLKSQGLDVHIIEFNENSVRNSTLLKLFDKILSKYFSLPFYTSKVTSLKNLKVFLKTTDLFLISESAGFSVLPMLVITKLFRKVNVNLFVMGLYSKHLRYPKLKIFHNMFIKILNFFVDNLLFLGKGELEKAIRIDSKIKEKSVYFPWCVDGEFWKVSDDSKAKSKEKILFVGNDGNRDDVLLTEIAKRLPQYSFIFVTNILKLVDLKLENVEIIQGQWGKNFLTDLELKDIYSSARISIIPLKESSQPSGQSVALQSMSQGVPVMISDTKGFWDRDTLIDKKHLILVKDNNAQEWTEQIERLYKSKDELETISQNALEVTKSKFSMKNFNNQISELISDQN